MKTISKKTNAFFGLISLLGLIVSFQNCGSIKATNFDTENSGLIQVNGLPVFLANKNTEETSAFVSISSSGKLIAVNIPLPDGVSAQAQIGIFSAQIKSLILANASNDLEGVILDSSNAQASIHCPDVCYLRLVPLQDTVLARTSLDRVQFRLDVNLASILYLFEGYASILNSQALSVGGGSTLIGSSGINCQNRPQLMNMAMAAAYAAACGNHK